MISLDNFQLTKAEGYTKKYILKDYGKGYQRLILGKFRKRGLIKIKDDVNDDDYIPDFENIKRISLSRSKRNVREIAICNDFKYFVTLTINSSKCDRYSLDEVQDLMHKSFKEYQRRCKHLDLDFKYLCITESHIDGAYHFHCLFTCVLPTDIYTNFYGYLSSHFFDDRLGFNSFSLINNINACSFYITKYITKNCVINSHHQVYFCSKGLKRAECFELPHVDVDDDTLKDFWNDDLSNEFCKIRDFDYNDLPIDYQMWLFNKKDIDYQRKLEFKEKLRNFEDNLSVELKNILKKV